MGLENSVALLNENGKVFIDRESVDELVQLLAIEGFKVQTTDKGLNNLVVVSKVPKLETIPMRIIELDSEEAYIEYQEYGEWYLVDKEGRVDEKIEHTSYLYDSVAEAAKQVESVRATL